MYQNDMNFIMNVILILNVYCKCFNSNVGKNKTSE